VRSSLITVLWWNLAVLLTPQPTEAEVQQYLVNNGMTEAAAWISPNAVVSGDLYGPVGETTAKHLHWNVTQYLTPEGILPSLPAVTDTQGSPTDGLWSVGTRYMKAERFQLFGDYFYGFRLDSSASIFACNEEDLGIQANHNTEQAPLGLIPVAQRKTLDQMQTLAFSLATLVRTATNGSKCKAGPSFNRGRTSLVLSFEQLNGSRSLIYWITLYDSKNTHFHGVYCDLCFSQAIWQIEDDIDILGQFRPLLGGAVQNYGHVDILPRLRFLIANNPYFRQGVSRNPADYRLEGVAVGVTTFGDALIDGGFAHLTIRDEGRLSVGGRRAGSLSDNIN